MARQWPAIEVPFPVRAASAHSSGSGSWMGGRPFVSVAWRSLGHQGERGLGGLAYQAPVRALDNGLVSPVSLVAADLIEQLVHAV
jgi:hypothetical protein